MVTFKLLYLKYCPDLVFLNYQNDCYKEKELLNNLLRTYIYIYINIIDNRLFIYLFYIHNYINIYI